MITDLALSYHSDKHFSEFLPTRWQQKSAGIDMEQNYVTVTLCIEKSGTVLFLLHRKKAAVDTLVILFIVTKC